MRAKTQRADKVKIKKIRWLWYNRLPEGKFGLIGGDPGTCKTFLTLYIIAILTQGKHWPDCKNTNKACKALILSAEDDAEDTIVPRLIAAGAKLSNIRILTGVKDNTKDDWFNLQKHIPVLEDILKKTPSLKIIVIDPLNAYLGGGDSHKDSDVRGILGPLIKLASKYNVTVLSVMHLNKSQKNAPMYRFIGGIGFMAAARFSWLVERDRDNPEWLYFAPMKTNLSVSPTTMRFTISKGCVTFDKEEYRLTGSDLLCADKKIRKVDDAVLWLKDILSDGPKSFWTIQKKNKDRKNKRFTKGTIDRAKITLKIRPYKESKQHGQWVWALNT